MTDWSQIVHEYGPMVWRTIDRLLAHEADTSDCFQQTFIAAMELSQRENVRNWPAVLKRLATYRALDYLRKIIRESSRYGATLDPENVDVATAAADSQPEQAAYTGELAGHLRIALAKIDPQQAQVFCLACLEEWSYQEIATEMSISSNHVGVLLNRARTNLRERLKQFEPATSVKSKSSKVPS